jgi:hypothetical protein
MSRYRLHDDGYPTFKKIMQGRKWVGRVCKSVDPAGYLGIIGKTTVRAPTEKAAFEAVVAKHLGYNDVSELNEINREVKAVNRVRKAQAREVVDEMIRGNFEPLDRLLGGSRPIESATEVVRQATREFFKK